VKTLCRRLTIISDVGHSFRRTDSHAPLSTLGARNFCSKWTSHFCSNSFYCQNSVSFFWYCFFIRSTFRSKKNLSASFSFYIFYEVSIENHLLFIVRTCKMFLKTCLCALQVKGMFSPKPHS
jgi:hypothetical protein